MSTEQPTKATDAFNVRYDPTNLDTTVKELCAAVARLNAMTFGRLTVVGGELTIHEWPGGERVLKVRETP